MEKLQFDPALLPKVEQEDEDKPGDDGTTLDDDGTILDDDADDENPRKSRKKLSISLDTSDHAGTISWHFQRQTDPVSVPSPR